MYYNRAKEQEDKVYKKDGIFQKNTQFTLMEHSKMIETWVCVLLFMDNI